MLCSVWTAWVCVALCCAVCVQYVHVAVCVVQGLTNSVKRGDRANRLQLMVGVGQRG